jgi:hypothetical protein
MLRNANVENDADFKVLTDFKECLLHKFRNNRKAAGDLRAAMKDNLLKGLSSRYINELPSSKQDRISSFLIYDVCGYMLKTRSCQYEECDDCKKSVITTEDDLPEEFEADEFTRARTQGGLLFVTPPVFHMLSKVENVVAEHLKSPNHIYLMDSFQDCIAKVSLFNVLPLFCDNHRDNNIGMLILEDVKVRYYFESKRLNNLMLSKEKASVQKSFKLGTTAHTKDVNTK